jgi:hypothetical protein
MEFRELHLQTPQRRDISFVMGMSKAVASSCRLRMQISFFPFSRSEMKLPIHSNVLCHVNLCPPSLFAKGTYLLAKADTNVVSLSESLDTATPAGRMVFTVLGAVAKLERSFDLPSAFELVCEMRGPKESGLGDRGQSWMRLEFRL